MDIIHSWFGDGANFAFIRNLFILTIIGYFSWRFFTSHRASSLRAHLPILGQLFEGGEARHYLKIGDYAKAAELYLAGGKRKEAIQAFMDGGLFARAADIYLQQRNLEQAAVLYERGEQHERAAEIYVELKQLDKAEATLAKIGKQGDLAKTYEAMGSNQLAADAHRQSGRLRDAVELYLQMKDQASAAECLLEAVRDDSFIVTPTSGYNDRAAMALHGADLLRAVKRSREAAELLLSFDELGKAAEAFEEAGHHERAIELYLQCDRCFDVARVYNRMGQHTKASEYEAEGHVRQNNDLEAAKCYVGAGAYAKAGDIYRTLNEPLKAAEMYEKAKEWSLAGTLFIEAGEFERAAHCFEKDKMIDEAVHAYGQARNFARQVALLEKAGRYVDAAHNYYERGLLDEALQVIEKIDEANDDFIQANALRGRILMDQGKLSEAKLLFEDALSETADINEKNAGVIYDLAKVSGKLGEESRVLHSIEKLMAKRYLMDGGDGEQGSEKSQGETSQIHQRLSHLLAEVSRLNVNPASQANQQGDAATQQNAQSGAKLIEEQRYIPVKEIGRGGMGIVYTARDTRLDRIVALKVLPANLRKNSKAVATFKREAKSTASLNHPNIVTVFDAGIENNEYFIAMEMIEGLTVKQLIKKKGKLPLAGLFTILGQLLSGLAYAHDRNIVHRDLSTNNIMWSRGKMVKIMDFGLAKVVQDLQSEQSIIGGTPSYMSPEQTLGKPVDQRTDIYSLGVCLFEMATGRLPFQSGNLGYHHVHTPPPDPADYLPDISPKLRKVILQNLEKEPDKRPQSVNEIRRTLQSVMQNIGRE